jgi:hypothetical protein
MKLKGDDKADTHMEEYQQDEGRESVFQEGGCQAEAVSRPCTEQNENRTHERNEAAPMQTSPRMLTQFVGVTSWVLVGGVTTKCCVESSFEFRVVRGSERSKAGKNQTVEKGDVARGGVRRVLVEGEAKRFKMPLPRGRAVTIAKARIGSGRLNAIITPSISLLERSS